MMHEMTQSVILMHDLRIDDAQQSQSYDATCATSEMHSNVSLVANVDVYHSLQYAMLRYRLVSNHSNEAVNDEVASTID